MENAENGSSNKAYDTDAYLRDMVVTNQMREPALRAAIEALRLPSGSRGLDAGCGVGLQALLLAEEIGPSGHVTGLDVSPEFLDHGRGIIERAGFSERISFQEGDVAKLPYDDNYFDWVWSADCVGYAPWEPLPLLQELARVVKPGGIVALAAWSSERLLPGYPLLEARLGATSAGLAPFTLGKDPQKHFLRALGWFQEAGLRESKADTFAGSIYAPLSYELRSALESLFGMRWPGVESELTPEVAAEYRRLCLPQSPDFILNLPDYYAFFTYSIFHGRVPQ
jgi:demethylmenaquinone methyltransferase/2-methoxy-6-polyprenyl-1,4-benzoquinol methylase